MADNDIRPVTGMIDKSNWKPKFTRYEIWDSIIREWRQQLTQELKAKELTNAESR